MSNTKTINVKMLPAKKGDSFLISYDGFNILIDCGFKDTFKNHIRPVLQNLSNKKQKLDKLIITHIDTDHINGAIPLLSENESYLKSKIIPIEDIWHNSYRHLEKNKQTNSLPKEATDLLNSIKPPKKKGKGNIKVGYKQSVSLSALILEGGYNWNKDANGKSISTNLSSFNIHPKIKVHILSPNQEKLDGLLKYWKKELKRKGFKDEFTNDDIFDEKFEALLLKERRKLLTKNRKQISSSKPLIKKLLEIKFGKDVKEDTSKTNGSSIAFLLEIEDKKLLFTGDAHPSVIIDSLEKINKNKKEEFPMKVDLMKVVHHGSFSNNNPELFKLVHAENYIISTNGDTHNHPDLETLAHIISTETNDVKQLHFNYKNAGYNFLDNPKLKEECKYDLKITSDINL